MKSIKKLVKWVKKMFKTVDGDVAATIKNIESIGKSKIASVNDVIQNADSEHTQTLKDLATLLEETRDLELEKKTAEIKAEVQTKIADVKQKSIEDKNAQKVVKIAQIKSWLASI